jgi:ketol-acid reductoisomerase
VLCGGVTALVTAAFETLVEAGYQPEIAYYEVLNELKMIVDMMYQGGIKYMRYSVSDTAEYGDYTSGPRVIDDRVRATLKQILGDIQSGEFANEWIAENENGRGNFMRMRRAANDHQIEEVGEQLRSMMSWLPKKEIPTS